MKNAKVEKIRHWSGTVGQLGQSKNRHKFALQDDGVMNIKIQSLRLNQNVI